jgi:hypothetical protein
MSQKTQVWDYGMPLQGCQTSEYDATSTRATPCYSNLYGYGAQGRVQNIVVPTPISAPLYFKYPIRPYKNPLEMMEKLRQQQYGNPCAKNCSGGICQHCSV